MMRCSLRNAGLFPESGEDPPPEDFEIGFEGGDYVLSRPAL